MDKLRHKVIEGGNSTERVGVDCVGGGGLCGRGWGGGGLCGWGWTVWEGVGVDCVGGGGLCGRGYRYARICLIAFYFKLFLSHLFNRAELRYISE